MPEMDRKRMTIDDRLIDNLARLSSIELQPQERRALRSDLLEIVSYVERLGELDLDAISSSTRQAQEGAASQPDVPRPGLLRNWAFMNAPDTHEEFFKAPPIMER